MFNLIKDKNYKKNFFLICGWLIIWGSIGITPDYLMTYKISLSINIVNFLRGLLPLLYFFFLILFLLKNKTSFIKNTIIQLISAYFILQIIGALFYQKTLYDIYYIILGYSAILIIFNQLNIKNYEYLNNISIFFILILFINFFPSQINNFLFTPLTFYQQWGLGEERGSFINLLDIDYIYPNILGFSRYALILFLFIFFLEKKSMFSTLLMILLVTIIFLLQARATILIYCIFIIFHPFFFGTLNFKIYIKKILIFILIPIGLFFLVNQIKINYFMKEKVVIRNVHEQNYFEKHGALTFRPISYKNYTSDRYQDWKMLIDGNKKVIFGLGPQGDRHKYNKTASNSLVYAFVTSGYLGFVIFFTLSVYALIICLKFFWKFKKSKISHKYFYYPSVCLIFLARSFFETSIAVFGIDFIFFFYTFLRTDYLLKNET